MWEEHEQQKNIFEIIWRHTEQYLARIVTKLSPKTQINTSHSCGDQHFKCEQCNFKSKQKSHLDRHMKVHAPKVPKLMKEYNCFHCKKTFDRKFNLKVHVKTHTKLKVQQESLHADVPYSCSHCEYD